MRTSTDFTPYSCAARPAFSAATCAANGVDLREPRKPAPPDVAHDRALPWRSVIVTTVLLNDACTCTMASVTTRLVFFLVLATTGLFICVFPKVAFFESRDEGRGARVFVRLLVSLAPRPSSLLHHQF